MSRIIKFSIICCPEYEKYFTYILAIKLSQINTYHYECSIRAYWIVKLSTNYVKNFKGEKFCYFCNFKFLILIVEWKIVCMECGTGKVRHLIL